MSLVGRLTDSATGAGVVGAAVQAETLHAEGAWVPVAGATTDGAGAVAVAQTLGSSATYRLHHGTTGSLEESASAAVTVTVAALTAEVSAPAVRVGRPVTVRGVLAAGGPRGLRVERRVAGSWQLLTPGDDRGRRQLPGHGDPDQHRVLAAARGPRAVGGPGSRRRHCPRWTRSACTPTRCGPGARSARTSTEFRAVGRRDVRRPARLAARPPPVPPSGRRVGPGDLTVVLAAGAVPADVLLGSAPPSYSCRDRPQRDHQRDRWRSGSRCVPGHRSTSTGDMVVNHETGHWLGDRHAYCPAARPAAHR